MNENDTAALERAIRHCQAGLKALEAAREGGRRRGAIYPTHLYVAAVELATSTELSLAIGLRNQETPAASDSQKR